MADLIPSGNVEDKIIEAAIECIEKYGLQGATSRRIAQMAGVNGAAINYYFRSKDVLIQRVIKKTLDNAFDWSDFAELPAHNPHDKCFNIFDTLVQGGLRYPGITRFHFTEMIEHKESSQTFTRFNDFFKDLLIDLQKDGVNLTDDELKLAVAEIASASLFVSLIPSLFQESLDINLQDEVSRKEFIRRLVDKLLS